jgi:TRAP-type C4-dicarboxylate transport system permease small subunit
MSTPTIPPAIPASAQQSSKATMALVLGVLGIICCGLLAPVAWYMANDELKSIDAGRIADSNRGMAQVAKILGIIGTILLGLAILWVVLFGGMATIGALTGAGGSY